MGRNLLQATAGLALLALVAFATSAQAFQNVSFKASSTYKGKPVTLRGELFKPRGLGPFPAVVLMHGCGGWQTSVHRALRVHARYLVKHGFAALNLDSFGPRRAAGGWVCKKISRLAKARGYRVRDAVDALVFLRAKTFVHRDNVFLMGQSHGGSVSVLMAQQTYFTLYGHQTADDTLKPFRGVAAYYPWCGAFNKLGGVKLASPLIAFVGDRDDWTPSAGCKTVDALDHEYKVVVYKSAFHSFDLNFPPEKYLGHWVGYNRQATLDSRRQMVAFFRKHVTADLKAGTPLSVRQVQKSLKALGYDPGPVDGALGAKTLAALNALRSEHALAPVTGLDAGSYKLLRALKQ